MNETKRGPDLNHEREPGPDAPAPSPRISRLQQTTVRTERGVLVVSGLDADGRFCWLLSAIHPETLVLSQAWIYDRRQVQGHLDRIADSLASGSGAAA